MNEEKKISLEELENLLDEDTGNSGLNFQTIFATLVLNWQWFLLSLIICVCGALIWLRYAEPVYSVSARMLIKDDMSKQRNTRQMLANMEDLGFMTTSTGIENEMEILQSRILVRDVVKDLKLYTEYRSVGRIVKPILYGTQPLNVDLDPLHLDSLDKKLLSGVNSLQMILTHEDKYYVVRGDVLFNGKAVSSFSRRFTKMPATFQTEVGTLTFTTNVGYDLKEDQECHVTILPPMQVATQYLKAMTVEPTSKKTSIAQITLKDKNINGIICYGSNCKNAEQILKEELQNSKANLKNIYCYV